MSPRDHRRYHSALRTSLTLFSGAADSWLLELERLRCTKLKVFDSHRPKTAERSQRERQEESQQESREQVHPSSDGLPRERLFCDQSRDGYSLQPISES